MKARYIDPEEVERLAIGAGDQTQLILWILEITGLRIGDLLKVRVSDLSEDPPGIRYVAQKTGKPGFAPVPIYLVREMRKHSRYGWVFPSPVKRRAHLTRQAVWASVKRAAARAGVDAEGVSPHSYRKAFAVRVLKDEGLAAAKEALQHEDTATTEIYALSDYVTGENAEKPILRKDLPMILHEIARALQISLDKN